MLERLYRLLLGGLDEEARRRYGDEMLGAFSAALADARQRGVAAWAWTAARMLADAARCAAAARGAALLRWGRPVRLLRRAAAGRELSAALRRARRTPVQSGAIVASVALSVGGATGLFSVADALLLRPLAIEEPERLVALTESAEDWTTSYFSYAVWRAVDESGVLDVVGCRRDALELRPPSAERLAALWVTGRFFDSLGLRPRVGRLITEADDRSSAPVAVLGHRYWETRFAADPGVVGRTLDVGGVALTVVGVAPEGFVGVDVDYRFDVALPFGVERLVRPEASGREYAWGVRVLGRLAPGDSLAAATARARAAQPRIRAGAINPAWVPQYKAEYLRERLGFRSAAAGLSSLGTRYAPVLWVLLATLAVLVALAAANTASLLAARVVRRRRELAVRATLGAPPGRVALPVVLESLLLTGAGTLLGYAVAAVCGRLLLASLGATPDAVERASPLDLRVVGFAAALLVAVAVASALVPALQAARLDPLAAMRPATPIGRPGRAGQLLVANQIALSLALLIVAGVSLRTLVDLARRPVGFEGRGLLVARLQTDPLAPEGGASPVQELGRRAREALTGAPELEDVGVSWITPLDLRARMESWYCGAGDREPATDWVHFNFVSPGWFATFRTRIVAGRSFEDADAAGAPGVAIVNRAFAAAYPCGGPVLGAVIHAQTDPDLTPGPPLTVVGIADDAVYRSYRESAPPTLYRPYAQMADTSVEVVPPISVTVRPRGSAAAATRRIEATLGELSPATAVEVEPFAQRLDRAVFKERLLARLSAAIALLGGLLAVLGSYAVAALDASARRRETAIRRALGASGLSIYASALRRGATALGLGLGGGAALGAALSRVTRSWLGTAAPASPPVYLGAASLLALVTLAAAMLAAGRTLRATPARLLTEAD